MWVRLDGWRLAPRARPSRWPSSPTGPTDLVGGTTYTCYSIEVDANNSSINGCSDPVDVIAALNAPTLASAAPGSSPAHIDITASSPTGLQANANTQLKVACVDQTQGCPDDTGPWVDVQIDGAAQAVSVLNAGQTYTCFAAEFSTIDTTYRVCSSLLGTDAVAAMNAPTLDSAAPGSSSGNIIVAATSPTNPANVDATLKYACVPYDGGAATCPDADAVGANGWSALGTITGLTAGDTYTCFAGEFSATASPIYRVCSSGGDATASPLNAPTVSATSGLVVGQVEVTAQGASPANINTELKVACAPYAGSVAPSCPSTGNTWQTYVTGPMQVLTDAAGSALVSGIRYSCFSAEFSDINSDIYSCSDPSDVIAAMNPPTVSAATGLVGGAVSVTGTAASPPNPGTTTLKVACVDEDGVCPDVGAPGWVAVGTSGTAEQVAKLSDGSADLVGGTTYTCYSIEVDANNSSINGCSDPVDVIAALNAPTLASAAPGSSPAHIDITASSPTGLQANANTQLKVACVDQTQGCPDDTGPWVDVQIDGAAQAVSVLNAGQTYTCFAAEFSTIDTIYRVCSSLLGTDAVAAMNAPTLDSAAPGSSSGNIIVAATSPTNPANVDATLKYACVPYDGGAATCPDADAVGANGWSALGTITGLTAGDTYTCFAGEFSATASPIYRVCSSGGDATASPLNAPTVSATSGLVVGQVEVTAQGASPANINTELKVACAPYAGSVAPSCPSTGNTWQTYVTGPMQVLTDAAGSALVSGIRYSCFSAEFSDINSDIYSCSDPSDVIAAMNPPTVSAATGLVGGAVSVTGTAASPPNPGTTTLKVACVDEDGVCPDVGAPGWVAVGTSGTAEQVAKLSDGSTDLVGGTTYTCWSAEFDATSRVCSTTGVDATPPLFYKAANDVTILCPGAAVGDTGSVDGVEYTKRNRDQLRSLVQGNQADLVTSCTSGVTDMSGMFFVRVSARLLLLLRCLLTVLCIPWMSRRSLDTVIRPWMHCCRVPPPSTSPSVPGTRARRRPWLACSRYEFLPICCSCCVASSPFSVSPGCLDAHWPRPFVPGCTTVGSLCLQPAHR